MPLKEVLSRIATIAIIGTALLIAFWQYSAAQPDVSMKFAFKQQLWQQSELSIATTQQTSISPSFAVFPPGTYRDYWGIVFQSSRDGNFEIYLHSIATGELRLTNNAASDIQPRLNNDASQLVFVSDRDGNNELYTMNLDGTGQTRLTFNDGADTNPYWSPDSNEILFVSASDGNNELYIVNKDGLNLRRLTNNNVSDFQPSLSADGQHIAWIQAIDQSTGSLWIMNRDGSEQHPILTSKQFIQHPIWSPDSTQIAFDYDATGDLFNDIATILPDGTGLQLVPFGPGEQPFHLDRWMGSWAPDSKFVLYTRIQWAENAEQNFYIDYAAIGISCGLDPYCLQPSYDPGAKDFLPDVRPLDHLPPITKVEPLPPFTRRATDRIMWHGSDQGISGIKSYDVQYRYDSEATWHDWIVNSLPSNFNYAEPNANNSLEIATVSSLPTNGPIHFRSRSQDRAGNLETWMEEPSGVATTLYSFTLTGKRTDSRGVPIPNQSVSLNPASLLPLKTDLQGRFSTYIGDVGTYQLDNSLKVDIQEDLFKELYAAPTQNLIVNGGFEANPPLDQWAFDGDTDPVPNSNGLYRDNNSIRLGANCPETCWAEVPIPSSIKQGTSRTISLLATDGSVHLLSATSGFVHQLRLPTGKWQPHTYINSYPVFFNAAIDSMDTLHIVWSTSGDSDSERIYYITRSATGVWSIPQYLGSGGAPTVAVDTQGIVHLVYLCVQLPQCSPEQIKYRTKVQNGQWSDESTIALGWLIQNIQLTATKDNSIHLVWFDRVRAENHNQYLNRVQYSTTKARQNWSAAQTLFSQFNDANGLVAFGNVVLLSDSLGTVHVLWSQYEQSIILHRQKKIGKPWSEPELKDARIQSLDYVGFFAAFDHQNALQFLATHCCLQPPFFWQQAMGQSWQRRQIVTNLIQGEYQQGISSFIATNSNPLLIYQQLSEPPLRVIELNSSSQTGTSTLFQEVYIPDTVHRPTLAFMYETSGTNRGRSQFSVRIAVEGDSSNVPTASGITTSPVFTSNVVHDWQLGWVDMEPWKGKTVDVIFETQLQESNESFQVYLDDISLGPWETPVVTQSVPAHLEYGESRTITIYGDNFMTTPEVKVGDFVADKVEWIDEQTLKIVYPTELPAGIYDIWVKNPGGAESVLVSGFSIGKQLYLPVIAR